jgi:hypothetical protein
MRNIFFAIVIVVSAIIVSCSSCGGNKNKSSEDSLKKADSIANVIIGKWKEQGKGNYVTISRSGELYMVTSSNGTTFAYKLNGQILNSVDGTGPIYSLMSDGALLKGSSKFTKTDKENSTASSGTTTTTTNENATASKPSTISTTVPTTTTTTTKTKTTSVASELTIICDNTINLRQSASSNSAIIRGLANGQVCKIISRGKQATLSGKTDYWYEIKAEGDKGWVFGAYTSLRQQ